MLELIHLNETSCNNKIHKFDSDILNLCPVCVNIVVTIMKLPYTKTTT